MSLYVIILCMKYFPSAVISFLTIILAILMVQFFKIGSRDKCESSNSPPVTYHSHYFKRLLISSFSYNQLQELNQYELNIFKNIRHQVRIRGWWVKEWWKPILTCIYKITCTCRYIKTNTFVVTLCHILTHICLWVVWVICILRNADN